MEEYEAKQRETVLMLIQDPNLRRWRVQRLPSGWGGRKVFGGTSGLTDETITDCRYDHLGSLVQDLIVEIEAETDAASCWFL